MSEDVVEYRKKELTTAAKTDLWTSIPIDPQTLIPEPRNLAEMWFCSRFFASSGIVPLQFSEILEEKNDKGENIYIEIGAKRLMCAWMMGRQVGMNLWSAMKSIAVINNRATIFGEGAIGLIRSKDKLEWIKEGLTGENKSRSAWCEVKRKGEPAEITYKKTFTWEQAKEAGLLDDTRKKHTWGKYLDDMLISKARARALKVAFSDVLEGLSIAEDVSDYEEDVITAGGEQRAPSAFDFMENPLPEFEPAAPVKSEEKAPPAAAKPQKAPPPEPDELNRLLTQGRLTREQHDLIGAFLEEVSIKAGVEIPEIRKAAATQFRSFLSQYSNWLGRKGVKLNVDHIIGKAAETPPAAEPQQEGGGPQSPLPVDTNWWLTRENWINSRGMGFKTRIEEHLEELDEMPDNWVYEEIFKKWMGAKDIRKMGKFPLLPKVVRHCLATGIDITTTV